jgi:4-amino-4-deoxychorismate lyase
LENILAREAAKLQGAEEGVWLNTKGYIAEGTMSNLFFIKDGTLFTPSLSSGCLPGTRRQLILGLARSLQIPNYEGLYPLSDLLLSDEIFMTNTLMGIMPVRQVDDIPFPLAKKSAMRVLESAYKALIENASHPSNNFQV